MRSNWRNRLLTIVCIGLMFACTQEKQAEQADTYVCPMHPTVVSDRQGTCPVCGMDLVRKAQPGEEVQITEDLARLIKSPNEIVTADIRTVKAEFKSMNVLVKATGQVTYDTRNVYTIPTRIAGRLEKVYLKYAYQQVKKGQKIAEVYSPELLTAQRELLYLITNDPENSSLINAVRSKLSLLGATISQIDEMTRSKETSARFAIYSPYDGYLVDGELIREGDYVTAGQALVELVNTSALRVELNVPLAQSADIKVNDVLQLNFGDIGTRQAKVDLVQPFFNANEEFVKVLVNVNDNNFHVGQLVDATIEFQTTEALWLHKEAILDLGLGRVVFVNERGSFKPKEVIIGVSSGDFIEIRRGLVSSDEVAANAQYLVDSESFVRNEQKGQDQNSHEDHGQPVNNANTIMLSDTQVKLANITTQRATMKPVGQTLAINAVLRSDETLTEVISSRAAGRIEKLYARQTGLPIKKGQPLYEIYSETLLTLQKEYLLAFEQYETLGKAQTRYASYLEAAERKLLLYGLTQSQIGKLGHSKKVEDRITFLAPLGGTIAGISAIEGQYVEEGTPLYRIDDISKLWVEAEVYPNELQVVESGAAVKVSVAGYETSPVDALIGFVSPEYRAGSQITVVRASISNPGGKFKPGMQAQVMLTHSSRKALSVPSDAVIHDGRGMHLYVQTALNTFQPRMVKTGVEDFDQVEIVDGIMENDIVAVTGAYLLYSEFILKKGMNPMAGHHH